MGAWRVSSTAVLALQACSFSMKQSPAGRTFNEPSCHSGLARPTADLAAGVLAMGVGIAIAPAGVFDYDDDALYKELRTLSLGLAAIGVFELMLSAEGYSRAAACCRARARYARLVRDSPSFPEAWSGSSSPPSRPVYGSVATAERRRMLVVSEIAAGTMRSGEGFEETTVLGTGLAWGYVLARTGSREPATFEVTAMARLRALHRYAEPESDGLFSLGQGRQLQLAAGIRAAGRKRVASGGIGAFVELSPISFVRWQWRGAFPDREVNVGFGGRTGLELSWGRASLAVGIERFIQRELHWTVTHDGVLVEAELHL